MKYFLIDTNEYRNIFSDSEGFSDQIYNLIIKLIDSSHLCLLIPQQIQDEIERNKYGKWLESDLNSKKSKIESKKKDIDKINSAYSQYKSSVKLINEVEKEIKILEKDRDKVEVKYSKKQSKPNQKLKNLFNKATLIQENDEIIQKSTLRTKKGNPPYNDEKIGDALIWESLIHYLSKKKREKPELILIANDKKAWGDTKLNPFLEDEYRKKTNGKIKLIKKLSSISEMTQEEQEEMKSAEIANEKRNIINDFVISGNWVSAGRNAKKLYEYKQHLTPDDLIKIAEAGASNYEIYQSFFTSSPLNLLFSGENGYVIKEAENIPDNIWDKFVEKNQIRLKRQVDEPEIKPEDLPF